MSVNAADALAEYIQEEFADFRFVESEDHDMIYYSTSSFISLKQILQPISQWIIEFGAR